VGNRAGVVVRERKENPCSWQNQTVHNLDQWFLNLLVLTTHLALVYSAPSFSVALELERRTKICNENTVHLLMLYFNVLVNDLICVGSATSCRVLRLLVYQVVTCFFINVTPTIYFDPTWPSSGKLRNCFTVLLSFSVAFMLRLRFMFCISWCCGIHGWWVVTYFLKM
jgi:hypothetical protein